MTRPAPPPPSPPRPGLSALVLMGSSQLAAPSPPPPRLVPSLDFDPKGSWTFILRLLSAASLFFPLLSSFLFPARK